MNSYCESVIIQFIKMTPRKDALRLDALLTTSSNSANLDGFLSTLLSFLFLSLSLSLDFDLGLVVDVVTFFFVLSFLRLVSSMAGG
jgi:hypothetical protein